MSTSRPTRSKIVQSTPPTTPTKRSLTTTTSTSIITKKLKKELPILNDNEDDGDGNNNAESIILEEAKISTAKAELEKVLLHPLNTFEFKSAKDHFISLDSRWKSLLNSTKCSPFEGNDQTAFNPYRSLVTSIIGQQISYLAARSVVHKFTRVFYPHLPEKVSPPSIPSSAAVPSSTATSSSAIESTPFPTPAQILDLEDPMVTLKAAGLSTRKAEYVIELSKQFHDGRLNAEKLWSMEDEEVTKLLVAIRGIGIWTVDMFKIFSLRRQDIMPYGDLGVQKNMCKWYASDPNSRPSIRPSSILPTNITASGSSSIPSTPKSKKIKQIDSYPTPSTPSTSNLSPDNDQSETAEKTAEEEETTVNPFIFPTTTNNLTPEILKARLNKKLKGNIYLTPLEMEELSKDWKPFRSVACCLLWTLADGSADY